MAQSLNELDLVFAALSDTTRREILSLLLEDDMTVTDIAQPFQISLAAISKHLAVLEKSGLIIRERRGRINWCKLEPTAMKEAIVWIESFGQLKAFNLDNFEDFVEKELMDNSILSKLTLLVVFSNDTIDRTIHPYPSCCFQ